MQNMKIYYSAERRGFFSPSCHAELPADAVRVSAARHAELISAQERGAQIIPDARGRPELQFPSERPQRDILARQIKREAARRIAAISPAWRQMNDLRTPSAEGAARFAAIDAVRASSTDVEAALAATDDVALAKFDVANHPAWKD
mgnify:CR=1 FL=1